MSFITIMTIQGREAVVPFEDITHTSHLYDDSYVNLKRGWITVDYAECQRINKLLIGAHAPIEPAVSILDEHDEYERVIGQAFSNGAEWQKTQAPALPSDVIAAAQAYDRTLHANPYVAMDTKKSSTVLIDAIFAHMPKGSE